MSGIVLYGKTVKVFYGKTGEVISGDGEVNFELTYYILKNNIEVNEIKTDTYGVEIKKSNLDGVEIESESVIDISLNLREVETLANRLIDGKALPEELHDIAIDYVEEISCVVDAS